MLNAPPAGSRFGVIWADAVSTWSLVERKTVQNWDTGTIPSKTLRETVLYLTGFTQLMSNHVDLLRGTARFVDPQTVSCRVKPAATTSRSPPRRSSSPPEPSQPDHLRSSSTTTMCSAPMVGCGCGGYPAPWSWSVQA